MEAFPFTHRQRVRYGETDMQQVVYYANYLLYAEVGRVEYLRHLGLDYTKELLDKGIDFTIGEAHLKYRAPLRFDDEYDIKVRVGEIRHSSWTLGNMSPLPHFTAATSEANAAQIGTSRVS